MMQAKHSSAGRLTLPVIVVAAVLAAVYAVVTVMSYPVAFGIWQFRLSEAMMLLIPLGVINLQSPLFADKEKLHIRPNNLGFAAAVGVTLGCFLANYFNPGNLGPVDYLGGTCATAVSAYITYKISGNNKALNLYRTGRITLKQLWLQPSFYLLPLPSVVLNGAIVGVYLPFLFTPAEEMGLSLMLTNVAVFSVCEAVVVYVLGLALLSLMLPQENRYQRI